MKRFGAGIDLGTTFAAAAVFSEGATTPVPLEADGLVSPSVLAPGTEGGPWLVGREGLAMSGQPLARRFKRLIGSHPLLINGQQFPPEDLLSIQLRWVLDRISASQGGGPTAIVLTHPSNWGPHRLDRLGDGARMAGLYEISMLAEPVAAAVFHASRSSVEPGHVAAVYDLGGGTTDVSIMRKEADHFALLATSGTDSGSVDFDDALLDLAEERLGYPPELDLRVLGDLVTEAKIRLSTEPAVRLTVPVGSDRADIDLTVDDIAAVVTPIARQGVVHFQNALRQAGVAVAEVDTVLLAGGGSAMPLIQRLVAEAAGRQPVLSDHPKLAVAYGAAIAAGATAGLLQTHRRGPSLDHPPPQAPAATDPGWGPPVPVAADDTGPITVDTSGLEAGPSVIVFDVPTGPELRRPLAALLHDVETTVELPEPVTFGPSRRRDVVIVFTMLSVVIGVVVALAVS